MMCNVLHQLQILRGRDVQIAHLAGHRVHAGIGRLYYLEPADTLRWVAYCCLVECAHTVRLALRVSALVTFAGSLATSPSCAVTS
jgi:hypothetical protein